MKKNLMALLLVLACMAILAGCGCEHEWAEADCVNPRHCTLCEETEGTPLGHVWMAATCETPKTCEVCAATEGDPKGHSWVEATCEEAKHCETCSVTEGEALGHTWLEATTEAPKTCETCAATEGERIVTDPRFTTAQTKDLQGKWACTMQLTGEMMGIADFPGTLDCNLVLNFSNDGNLTFSFEIANEEAFMESMIAYTVDVMYKEFEAQGIDQATADAAMEETYGMTTEEYVRQQLGAMDFNAMFESIFAELDLGGVYYVEGNQLYVGDNWNSELASSDYILEGDTLSIPDLDEEMGTDTTMTRVTEE